MKNIYLLSFTFMFFISAIVVSTHVYSQSKPKGMVKIKVEPPEDFTVFYDRFHADSAFQMSRIRDPLLGMKVEDGQEILWNSESWELMNTKVQDLDPSIFKTKTKLKKKFFEQEVWRESPDYYAAHKFELHGNKWYLVFAYKEIF